MDPALTDRTAVPVLGVDEATLPVRSITIPGIEGSVPARILSTDLRGAATRMVRLDQGWGSGLPGAFTAAVEVFVIRGRLDIGTARVGRHEYLGVPAGRVLPRFRVLEEGVALLMTSAPVRYDTSAGGARAQPIVARAAAVAPEPIDGQPGRMMRRLGRGPTGDVWVAGAAEWTQAGRSWHRHSHAEECLVLDGELTLSHRVDGEEQTIRATAGTYFFRPAGLPHDGPGSGCSGVAVTFHRAFGELATEWLPAPADSSAS